MFHPRPNISPNSIPTLFTYPFHYQAHPLCQEEALRLQAHLEQWQWDQENLGKMFGVLLVQKRHGDVGFLWAYSGNITPHLDAEAFVPPIFDVLDPNGFFIEGEKELTTLNHTIEAHCQSAEYIAITHKIKSLGIAAEEALNQLKKQNNEAKEQRLKQRKIGQEQLSVKDFNELSNQLNRESQQQNAALKRLRQQWDEKRHMAKQEFEALQEEIIALKQERQRKSAALQARLFDQYQLVNAKGEVQPLRTIFAAHSKQQPPAAAGDCAGPRLLQYAYTHQLKPLAMAEFWWGKSPLSIIRKSGNYYPACRSKCVPILGHMLQGLQVEENPLLADIKTDKIEIAYEDESLLVINKPAGMLSVKGKSKQKSVLEYLQEQYAHLPALHIVHRLDMATSGLILLAKAEDTYKKLQEQFLQRTVKKRYEALLDGTLKTDEGRIELPLRVDVEHRPQQMVCYDYGKAALTIWRKLEEKEGKTRVAFYPQTGRTHQLRVHAAHQLGLNTPICGDALYGTSAQRLHLHAAAIAFTHPVSGKRIKVNSKVPF